MLQKLWLEDFYDYCMKIGGDTWTIMKQLLEFEADRRAISITINSFNTNLNDASSRDLDRKKLYCSFGTLYPELTLIKSTENENRAKEVLLAKRMGNIEKRRIQCFGM